MTIRSTGARGDPTTLLQHDRYPGHARPGPHAAAISGPHRAARLIKTRHALTAAVLLVGVLGALALTGCSRETPTQTAGERLDTKP
ncbi:MAG: hypothetical protein IPM99_19185 [Rubrivivax sp.]|jgi:hypothetical protein|nr:hypothetical protein [Rubrivivax sp.]